MTASESVRDLQCSYDVSRKQALLCEWREPEQAHAIIQSYHVNVIHNGRVLWQTATMETKLETNLQMVLGKEYIVSVLTETHTEGEAVETLVKFINPGMSAMLLHWYISDLSFHIEWDNIYL